MKITLIFKPDGSNTTTIEGVTGKPCEKQTDFLKQLGSGETQYTTEYYLQPNSTQVKLQH